MELVRGLHNISRRHKGCVLTVGNYDGVHLGHQRMIGALVARAMELRSTATVLVFEPSSKEFIDPEGAPPRLTRWREKFLALSALGVERLVTLRFDEYMRAMTPQCFVEELIVDIARDRQRLLGLIHAGGGTDPCVEHGLVGQDPRAHRGCNLGAPAVGVCQDGVEPGQPFPYAAPGKP